MPIRQSQENGDMLAYYSKMKQKFTIDVNGKSIVSDFENCTELMESLSFIFKTIIGKLNTMVPRNFRIESIDNYKTDLSDLATNICKDISSKLDDGILEPVEIVHIVMGAINGITMTINKKVAQFKDNEGDIKGILCHFVLSLLIILLSSLATANIIDEALLFEILNELCIHLETYRLASQMIQHLNFPGKEKVACCIIS